MIREVIEYFSKNIKEEIILFIKNNPNIENQIEEIRLRINQNIALKIGQDIAVLNHKLTYQELTYIFENICEKSIYAYTKQISEGFITIKGGNRVGITGSCIIENGKIINVNYISSLNFRIARQIKEISIPLLKHIIDIENNTIFNTIIAAAPGTRENNNTKRLSKKTIKSEYQK